jgi:hypothetical protein
MGEPLKYLPNAKPQLSVSSHRTTICSARLSAPTNSSRRRSCNAGDQWRSTWPKHQRTGRNCSTAALAKTASRPQCSRYTGEFRSAARRPILDGSSPFLDGSSPFLGVPGSNKRPPFPINRTRLALRARVALLRARYDWRRATRSFFGN